MKATTVVELGCACEACQKGSQGCAEYPDGKIPIGTIREHSDAWKWVRMGVAVPADEECGVKANMTEHQQKVVQHAQRRVSKGIAPEDYAAFDAGEMIGYFPDGTARPGPNAHISEGGILLDGWDEDS